VYHSTVYGRFQVGHTMMDVLNLNYMIRYHYMKNDSEERRSVSSYHEIYLMFCFLKLLCGNLNYFNISNNTIG